MKLHSDLREFIELLNAHGVEFVIVGGHAVGFHGYPRYTGDIDFLVRPTPENAARVVATLRAFGFPDAGKLEASLSDPETIVQLGRPPNRIDLLASISGVTFDDLWSRSVPATMDGVPVRFPDRDSLLANKRASGRVKDLADVDELERIARSEDTAQ